MDKKVSTVNPEVSKLHKNFMEKVELLKERGYGQKGAPLRGLLVEKTSLSLDTINKAYSGTLKKISTWQLILSVCDSILAETPEVVEHD